MKEADFYSKRLLRGAISRRSALKAAGISGLGLSAAALVGCGGGSDKSDGASGGSSLLTPIVDTTKQAVAGGTYQSFDVSDLQGFDPNGGASARAQAVATYAYLRLIKTKTSFDGVRREEPEGDLAESFEFSADGLQLTLKLRPNVIWDRRSPTNGRTVDTQDVLFSYQRFEKLSPQAVNFLNSKSPAAPITGISAPDSRTLVLKLAFPYVPLLATLTRGLNMWTLPVESDGKFDPKNEVRGNGPWTIGKYTPSSAVEYVRNPDYYVKGRPLLDGWSNPIIPEYATQLAQFRAGNIWGGVVKQEDVLTTKRDLPALSMFKNDYATGTPCFFFGFQGPFKDARLRQALSYVVDRQTFADVLSDTKKFQEAGLPSDLRINNFIGAGWEGYWLDPYGKDYGASTKYFKQDIAEAKKLVAAAGITGKLATKFIYPHNGYGAIYQQWIQALHGMVNDSGVFDAQLTGIDYQSDYIPNIHFGGPAVGSWDGFALTPAAQGDDAGHQLLVQYHSGGAATRQPKGADPKLDQMIDAQIRETDPAKRRELIKEVQRYMPTTMVVVPVTYQSAGYSLVWPWVGNAGAVRGANVVPAETYPYLWYDKATYDKTKA